MRVPQVEKLITLEVSDIQDGIGVTLNDTFFISSPVAKFVLWRTGTHQGLDLVKIAQFG